PNFKVPISGNGVAGNLSAIPASFNYGTVPTGDSATTQIKLYSAAGAVNTSGANMVFGSSFRIDSTAGPSTLFAGDTLRVFMKYVANGFIAENDTLLVTNNSGVSPLRVAFDGTPQSGNIAAFPSSFNYGNVVNSDSASAIIKIARTAGGNTRVDSIRWQSGTNFYGSYNQSLPFQIRNGDTIEVTSVYHATVFGGQIDTLLIFSNSQGSTLIKVPLSGTGVGGTLSALPTTFNYDTVAVLDSADATFKVFASGGVAVGAISMNSGSEFILLNAPILPDTLFAGDTLTFDVRFKPNTFGSLSDMVDLTNNSLTNPFQINVNGFGGAGALGNLEPNHNFGNTVVNDSVTQVVRVFASSGSVQLTSAAMAIDNHFHIIQSPALPATLLPGDTLDFIVSFEPLIVSALSDTLLLANNSSVNPLRVSFDGNSLILPVAESQVIIYPEADAQVMVNNPTTNYGSDPTVYVYGTNLNGGGQYPNDESQGYFRFDLSSIPAGAVITEVRMQVTAQSGFAYNYDGYNYATFVASDAWAEGAVTWNTRPALGNPVGQFFAWNNGSERTFSFSTEALRAQLESEYLGDGKLSLNLNNANGAYYNYYYSKEGAPDNARRPQLIVKYLPPTLATLTPTALFGNVQIGDSSQQSLKVFPLAGSVTVNNASIAVGTNYSIAPQGGLPRVLNPGDTLLVDAKFKPTTFGLLADSTTLANTTPINPFVVHFNGTGAVGTLATLLPNVNFGSVQIGDSVSQMLKLYPSVGAVTINSSSMTAGAEFFITPQTLLPVTLYPGDTLAVLAKFKPTVFGARVDTSNYVNNSGVNPFRINFGGTGAVGTLSTLQPNVNFGSVQIGDSSSQMLKVFPSVGAVTVDSASLQFGSEYSIVPQSVLPVTLNPGDTLAVLAKFKPSTFGNRPDTTLLVNNSASNPFRINFAGTGAVGSLSSNPGSVGFGNVALGQGSGQMVKLYTTVGAVRVSSLSIAGVGDFSISGSPTLPDTLFPGDTLTVGLNFVPTAFASITDTLLVGNNTGTTFRVPLSGTGIAGTLLSSVAPLSYGNVPLGNNSTQTVKLY
ncbi:choice-of-anchor D domain-containing protein, partial [Candidatus Saccharibacteria bacterium]|nr:choice-of-anchor D domain-containing protein [Candidatus Saccharibacteria bacterium]